MSSKAQRERASDVAARALLDAIVERRFPPGTPLRLKDLSEEFGMSMMPIREALRRLSALDIVEMEPRRGARVPQLTLEDLADTYYTRIHLEGLAVWEAAQNFTSEDSARAATALAEHEAAQRAGDRVAARDAHERFHFTIYAASGRGWLVRSILPTWRNSERYRLEAMRRVDSQSARDDEHARILAALISHDGHEAVRWMTNHLTRSVRLSALQLAEETGVPHEVAIPKLADVLGRVGTHLEPLPQERAAVN